MRNSDLVATLLGDWNYMYFCKIYFMNTKNICKMDPRHIRDKSKCTGIYQSSPRLPWTKWYYLLSSEMNDTRECIFPIYPLWRQMTAKAIYYFQYNIPYRIIATINMYNEICIWHERQLFPITWDLHNMLFLTHLIFVAAIRSKVFPPHDYVKTWARCPRWSPFVRRFHRWQVNSAHNMPVITMTSLWVR